MKLGGDISAIVTGGASGLGEAVVRALTSAEMKVALFDRDTEAGTRVAGETGALFINTDVGESASVAAGFEKARAVNGQERVLVACAGIAPAERTVTREGAHDPALFERTIRVNLLGVFNCAAQAAAGMATLEPDVESGERGVIVTTASIAAYEGQIGQIAYAASKAGVAGMTLPMARDLARHAIRVAAIAPGLFMTPMIAGFSQEIQDALVAKLTFPERPGDPAEFAAMVLQICTNSMINGTVIRLDGAYRMPPS